MGAESAGVRDETVGAAVSELPPVLVPDCPQEKRSIVSGKTKNFKKSLPTFILTAMKKPINHPL